MGKNYKRRGYPGKELKKQRKIKFIYEDPYSDPPLIGYDTNISDCEKKALRNMVARLKTEVAILTWEIQDNRETWKKNQKENVTLSKKIDKLKHHLASLNNQKETVLKNVRLSRLIKNIG